MKIFVSWSGTASRSVAIALRAWLGDLFPDVEPWMSAEDIAAGSRWNSDLDAELEASKYGILCLTRDNLNSKWLMFEAGRLSKSAAITRVAPFLFHLTPADVGPPLSQFQGVAANEAGALQLAQSLNALRPSPFGDEKLLRAFSRWWPDLSSTLATIHLPGVQEKSVVRTDREVLEELLAIVREVRFESSAHGLSKAQSEVKRIFALIERIERMDAAELDTAINRAERAAGEEHAGAAGAQLFLEVVTHWLSLGKSTHPVR